jgi:transposase
VAERVADPAGHKSSAGAWGLMTSAAQLLTDLERSIVKSAKPHEAHTFDRRRSIPGAGKLLALGLRYDIPDLHRFPRVQACVSDGRLGKGAQASAGKRDGPAAPPMGTAELPWAFSEAAVLCLRANPAGQRDLTRLEPKHGTGNAWTGLAHQLARAGFDLGTRQTAGDLAKFLHRS